MTPLEAIRHCFRNYAAFDGEASLGEFWWFFIFVALTNSILYAISPKVSALFFIGTLIPLLAVGVRRLHDTNRPGWWGFAFFIPVVGWLVLAFLLVQPGESSEKLR